MSMMEDYLSSIIGNVMEAEDYEKEVERLYLKARLEDYTDRMKTLETAVSEAVEYGQHMISPFMFGFTAGMRRAFAFVAGRKIEPLRKPIMWTDDPHSKDVLRLVTKTRKHVRRQTARLLWVMYSHFYKYNLYPLDAPQYFLEKRVVEYIKSMMDGITAAYKVREAQVRIIKLSGVDYEKVKNAETIENRWV